jgi:large subunit ribosomal protein L16
MGGGKGPIDHYVTPVKAGRVIVEMGGTCEFLEVSYLTLSVSKVFQMSHVCLYVFLLV